VHSLDIASLECLCHNFANSDFRFSNFREKYNFVVIEEAGLCTVLNVCIIWKGAKMNLILSGDPYQLPPSVMSARARYGNVPANAFPEQIQMPLIRQLIHNNWPYWLVPEQLRIEPGLWELAKFVIY
jgi:superfamily I DNA and/or RNA helicase